jgi:hypothetical protein
MKKNALAQKKISYYPKCEIDRELFPSDNATFSE